MGQTAEAEIKIRLTEEEFMQLPAVLRRLGFTPAGEEALTDHYLDYTRSPLGGYDFTRLRAAGGRYLLTAKHWVHDARGQAVRLEDEREITREEADRLRAAAVPRILHKQRREYQGHLDDHPATIALDALELAGTPHYFLECEMLVPREQATDARDRITAWMRAHLPVHDLAEAPSMLELLLGAEERR